MSTYTSPFYPANMGDELEAEARNKAFYLIKKYTSFTLLERAVKAFQNFMKEYGRLLDTPAATSKKQAWLEMVYKDFLSCVIDLEEGLALLRKGKRLEGYTLMIEGISEVPFWTRAIAEWSLETKPLFNHLGYKDDLLDHKSKPEGLTRQCFWAHEAVEALKCSISYCANGTRDFYGNFLDRTIPKPKEREKELEYLTRSYARWNYEALLQEIPQEVREAKGSYPLDWPPAHGCPEPCPPAPPKNFSSQDQIFSGCKVPCDGIYEPWFLDAKTVGCMSYLLKGSVAPTYQIEGSWDEEKVFWRLIWKDKRYEDGTIPFEETRYLEGAENRL